MQLFCTKPKRVVIITEEQAKYLAEAEKNKQYASTTEHKQHVNEAVDETFSTEELSSLPSFASKVKYCKLHLGNAIGNGSSRMVFQIDDDKVLKLAKNNKGLAQNEAEADWGAQNYEVLPILYQVDDDYNWLITEYVLPAKPQDFKHCLGMSFEEFCKVVGYINTQYNPPRGRFPFKDYSETIDNNEWLQKFYYYMSDYQPPLGDLQRIQNYGLCHRNGKAEIVLLDSGLTMDVWNDYYRR